MLAGNSSAEQKPQEEANQLSMQQHYSLDEIKMFCGSDQKMLLGDRYNISESALNRSACCRRHWRTKMTKGQKCCAQDAACFSAFSYARLFHY